MNSQENKIAKTDAKDLELTGICALNITYMGNDEYQLPTQKHREQLLKATAVTKSNANLKKLGRKNQLKITNKILSLYNTADEREIPLKRARSIVAKDERTCEENSCSQLCFPILKDQKSEEFLDVSKGLVDEDFEKARSSKSPDIKHKDSLPSLTTDKTCFVHDNPCVSHSTVLANILSSPPKFAKDIKVNPFEALTINSLTPAERLKERLPPTSPQKIKFPSLENTPQANTGTPKYWLKYLNQKIANKQSMACTYNSCKLCELNSESGVIVRNIEQGKGTLHIDLKRLTEVRSNNWSSYGRHYTRVHKLKYTKRQKSLMKSREKRVEVDEDYLSVDVDQLMNIYEKRSTPDDIESRRAGSYIQKQKDTKLSCDIQLSKSMKARLQSNKDDENTPEDATCLQTQTPLQRPTTTKLRSCVNFTFRKTCFTNIS